jgi:hypothetical protein
VKLSARKKEMLERIAWYKTISPMERLRFRLNRYLYHGYLDYIKELGKFDSQLSQLIEEAKESLEKESPNAEAKTEQAILAIKSKGIP